MGPANLEPNAGLSENLNINQRGEDVGVVKKLRPADPHTFNYYCTLGN